MLQNPISPVPPPQGFELSRLTLVDADGGVLVDTLVVPDNPITDYNTRYSGITQAMLQDCTTSVKDAQVRQVCTHVRYDRKPANSHLSYNLR